MRKVKSGGGRGERCRTAARDAPEGGRALGRRGLEAGAGRPFGPAGGRAPGVPRKYFSLQIVYNVQLGIYVFYFGMI